MKPIFLIGDWAIDHTVYVKVTRLCPEAPVPVVVPVRETKTPGMAGNVLSNMCSMLGLKAPKMSHFTTYRPVADCIKTRYVDEQTGYILLRVDKDYRSIFCDPSFKPADLYPDLEKTGASAIVVSDYGKGFLNKKIIQGITRAANHFDVPVFLDTKLTLGGWSKSIFCVKINQKEYNACCQAKAKPENFCQHLVVSRASEPTWYFSRVDGKQEIPVNKVNVIDVCGAGDTMLAALVLKYVLCGHLFTAIQFANIVASLAVTKQGVYSVTKEDLRMNGLHL